MEKCLSNQQIEDDTTRARARLPGLEIEIIHRRSAPDRLYVGADGRIYAFSFWGEEGFTPSLARTANALNRPSVTFANSG